MIKGALFALVVIAVVWLGLWAARAERGRKGSVAPFDMREPEPRASGTTARSLPKPARRPRVARARRLR